MSTILHAFHVKFQIAFRVLMEYPVPSAIGQLFFTVTSLTDDGGEFFQSNPTPFSEGKCVSSCPRRFVRKPATNVCVPCPRHCLDCSSTTDCQQCDANSFMVKPTNKSEKWLRKTSIFLQICSEFRWAMRDGLSWRLLWKREWATMSGTPRIYQLLQNEFAVDYFRPTMMPPCSMCSEMWLWRSEDDLSSMTRSLKYQIETRNRTNCVSS